MIAPSELWQFVTSLLFVSLVSSTFILSTALLLIRLIKRFSAAMRCRIWILSLMACLLPAMLMTIAALDTPDVRAEREAATAVNAAVSNGQRNRPDIDSRLTRGRQARSLEPLAAWPVGHGLNEQQTDAHNAEIISGRFQNKSTVPRAEELSSLNSSTELASMPPINDIESSIPRRQLTLSVELCRVAVMGWITIGSVLIARFTVNVLRSAFMWRQRFRESATDDLQMRELVQCCEAIDADFKGVAIRASDTIVVPVVIGLFRPMIVLPTAAIDWPARQLRLVLQHELAHIHRKDIAWNCLVSLLRAIIWFQPLAWIVQRRLREDQEFACDDAVLLDGNDAPEYATVLIHIAEFVLHRRQCSVSSVAMANSHSVERRIRAILDASTERQETGHRRFTYLGGVALMLSLVVATSLALSPELALANQDVEPPSEPAIIQDSATTQDSARAQSAVTEKTPNKSDGDGFYKFRHLVMDKDGVPAAGAVVTIFSRSFSVEPAVTDADGWCELTVPSGTESAPTIFLLRAVSKTGDQIAFQRFELKGLRLVMTGPAMIMPTCLQKVLVNDSQGLPIAEAVVGTVMTNDIIDVSKTDSTGMALVRRSPEGGRVFALKDGAGFDFTNLTPLDISTRETEDITFTLAGARPVKVRFVTTEDFSRSKSKGDLIDDIPYAKQFVEQVEPLADTYFVPTSLRRPNGSFWIQPFLDSQFFDAICPKTNAAGEATIRWLPEWHTGEVEFQIKGSQFAPIQQSVLLEDADTPFEIKVDRLVEIRGRVVDQNGKPVELAVVKGTALPWKKERDYSQYNSSVQDGEFSMFVPPRRDLLLVAEIPGQMSHTLIRAILPLKSPLNVELTFGGRNRISGLLTSGPNRTPLPDRVVEFMSVSRSENFSDFVDAERRDWWLVIKSHVRTDEHGRYDLQVGDGEWQIQNPFDNREQNSLVVKGSFQVQKEFHSDDKTLLRTTIVSAKTQQEEHGTVAISGVGEVRQNPESVVISRTPHLIEATSPSGKAFTVWDGHSNEFRIFVAPVVTAHGQLLDENGTPLANRSIRYMILPSVPEGAKLTKKYDNGNSGSISTDEQGKFTLTNFIQGCECQVMATNDEDKEWAKKKWQVLKSVVPNSDDEIDLGQLALSQATPDVK